MINELLLYHVKEFQVYHQDVKRPFSITDNKGGVGILVVLQPKYFENSTNKYEKTGAPRPDVSQYSLQYDRLY